MKTSAILAAKVNGKFIGSLLNYDANPENLLPILQNYNTYPKAEELVSKGTITSLEETLEDSQFLPKGLVHKRDDIADLIQLAKNSDCQYFYFFAVNKWISYSI